VEAAPVNLALRAFSLAFLGWHLGLLFPGLAEPAFLAAAAAAGLTGGVLVRSWRSWLALPLAALVFLFLQAVLTLIPSPLDTLPLWIDRQMAFSLLPFALAWWEGWAFTDRPERRGWERLIHAGVVVALFWSQGPYHVTLYPHPLALALAFGLFLTSELLLLMNRPPRTKTWMASLLVAVVGIGVLWSLVGRYEDQSTASGGGLMKPDLFQFDFAPLVRLEDEISLGENLVLLYREEGSPQTRYLRRLILDSYEPTLGFSLSSGKGPSVGRKRQSFPPSANIEERIPVRQEYYLVNLDPSSLLALNEPITLTPYAQWNRSSFVNAYRVDSLVSTDALWLYNEQLEDGLNDEQRAFYTKGGDDAEIRALALEMTRGTVTPYEKANAILLALKEQYFYSLKPGTPGPRGALKHFLFEGKKGYCSYFAFSMTLLLRSLGIPARIAVGFFTDPEDAVLGFTPVRAYQAHAWVEVPFGPYGWLDFDPTSQTPAPGEPFQFPKGSDPEELSKMIAEILEAKPQELAETAEEPAPSDFSWDLVWTASTAAFPWVAVLALLIINEGWRHRWRWARLFARDSRAVVSLLWAELVFRARRSRHGPGPGETPEAWAQRSNNLELAALAAEVSRSRYAPNHEVNVPAQVAVLARNLGRSFDRLRPWGHRFAASVLPWWPA